MSKPRMAKMSAKSASTPTPARITGSFQTRGRSSAEAPAGEMGGISDTNARDRRDGDDVATESHSERRGRVTSTAAPRQFRASEPLIPGRHCIGGEPFGDPSTPESAPPTLYRP